MTNEELWEKRMNADKRRLLHFIAVTNGNLNSARVRKNGHREVLRILESIRRAVECVDSNRNSDAQFCEIFEHLTVATNTIRSVWGDDYVRG